MKYWYVCVLFILSFLCLYSPSIEIVGFGSIFTIQTLFTIILYFDILKDTNRSDKALHIQFSRIYPDLTIPFWWILVAGASLQFASVMLMIITTAFLYKKFKSINVSRDMRYRIQNFKGIFIAVTILMMIVAYCYINEYSAPGGGGLWTEAFRLVLLTCFMGILTLSSVDVFYANRLSVLIGSITDG